MPLVPDVVLVVGATVVVVGAVVVVVACGGPPEPDRGAAVVDVVDGPLRWVAAVVVEVALEAVGR